MNSRGSEASVTSLPINPADPPMPMPNLENNSTFPDLSTNSPSLNSNPEVRSSNTHSQTELEARLNSPSANSSALQQPLNPIEAVVNIQNNKKPLKKGWIVLLVILFILGSVLAYYLLIFRSTQEDSSVEPEISTPTTIPTQEPTPPHTLSKTSYFSSSTRIWLSYQEDFQISESENVITLSSSNTPIMSFQKLPTNAKAITEIAQEEFASYSTGSLLPSLSTRMIESSDFYIFSPKTEVDTVYLLPGIDNYIKILVYPASNSVPDFAAVSDHILGNLMILSETQLAGCLYILDSTQSKIVKNYCSGALCNFTTEEECSLADVISTGSAQLSLDSQSDGVGDCKWVSTGFGGSCSPKY